MVLEKVDYDFSVYKVEKGEFVGIMGKTGYKIKN